jgi:hypothetical protein
MNLNELETRELGKYFEQLLVSKLIKLKFEVFVPVLDKGIDFIIRRSDNKEPKYFELQVKSVRKEGGRLTIKTETFSPDQKNLYLVFFNVKGKEEYDTYLISSEDVDKIFQHQKQKQGKKLKPIYRLYAKKSDLDRIRDYEWKMETIPEIWKR